MSIEAGKGVLKVRKFCGLTQKELAFKLGVDPSTISSYEHGRLEPPMHVLVTLSEITGKSIDEILDLCHYKRVNEILTDVITPYRELNKNDLKILSPYMSCEEIAKKYVDLEKYQNVAKDVFK